MRTCRKNRVSGWYQTRRNPIATTWPWQTLFFQPSYSYYRREPLLMIDAAVPNKASFMTRSSGKMGEPYGRAITGALRRSRNFYRRRRRPLHSAVSSVIARLHDRLNAKVAELLVITFTNIECKLCRTCLPDSGAPRVWSELEGKV